MYIKNDIFGFLNSFPDFIEKLNENICESNYKETSVAELKNKLVSNSIKDLELFLSTDSLQLINSIKEKYKLLDKPFILLNLKKETIHRLNKIYYYYNDSTKFQITLLENRYYEKENMCIPIMGDEQLYIACSLEKSNIVSYLEIQNDKLEEYLNIILIKKIREYLKNNSSVIDMAGAKIILSEECNSQCSYCSQKKEKRDMTPITLEIAKKALYKLPNNARIMFFGGEPFLHIDLMKEIILWSNEYKNFKFAIQTNGQIIDREFFRDYYNKHDINLSMDGPEHVQDINRGKGSWKKAMNFFNAFYEETGKKCIVSVTLYKNVLKYFAETLKWHQETTKNGRYLWNVANVFEWKEEDFAELEKQMELLKTWYVKEKIYLTGWGLFREESDFSCTNHVFGHSINTDGTMSVCNRQRWNFKYDNPHKYIPMMTEDYDGVDFLSFKKEDISTCSDCERLGCLCCPTGWRLIEDEVYKPYENWCRAGKILVKTAIELRAHTTI